MIRQSEVQKLEDEAQELARTVSDQAVDLKKQKRELEELRCHTPRPSWPKLHEDMHAAGALSPAEPTGAHPQQASCQLAEKLSTRLMEHARNLQVCSIPEPAGHHNAEVVSLYRCPQGMFTL